MTVDGNYNSTTSFTVKKANSPNTDNGSSGESGTSGNTTTNTTPTSTTTPTSASTATSTPTTTATTTSKVTAPKTSDTIPIVAILILALGIGTIGITAFMKED